MLFGFLIFVICYNLNEVRYFSRIVFNNFLFVNELQEYVNIDFVGRDFDIFVYKVK